MTAPLASVRVLELARILAGPWCGQLLADLGADVVKVERSGAGDDTRQWGPPFIEDVNGDPLAAAYFYGCNRGKRSIEADFETPEGQALVRRLAEHADVVIENFKFGGLKKYGLDYESLKAINPGIVYSSISGFGQDGPYHKRPGFDQIAQGMGGLMSITGAPGEGPMRVGIPVADLTAGLFCALGILTALLERDVSGQGQWVQTSLLQAQVFMLDFQASRWLMEGDVPQQAGNNHPTSIPTGVFKTSDGYINIATTGGKIWERCAQAIGAPELITNADYATGPARSKRRDALNAEIERRTEQNTTAHWVETLNAAGVPCGPIYSIDQMFDDAQVKHLGLAQDVPNDQNRKITLVSQPFTLSRTPSRMAARPPEFGEQTEEILAEFGFSPDEITALRDAKVV